VKNSGRPYDLTENPDPSVERNWAIAAPWRSLIYRNVDTPFPYAADLALLPHMPMNVPGYDCRVPRLMAEWMVSIPAVRKSPGLDEYLMPSTACGNDTGLCKVGDVDTSAQPYLEVKPGEGGYDVALKQADQRLLAYHEGRTSFGVGGSFPAYSRYSYCPDTADIVDPTVTGSGANVTPTDLEGHLVEGKVVFDPKLDRHHHFIDDETGQIEDIPWSALAVGNPARIPGYEVREYMVVLRGRKRGTRAAKSRSAQ